MKRVIEAIIGVIMILLLVISFFCPLLISLHTGNWWYMFLFMVSWIPTAAVVLLVVGVYSILDEVL